MARYRVTCVKRDNFDTDRRIQGIGGSSAGGWFVPIDLAIRMILDRVHSFYVNVNGWETEVIVDKHPVSGRLFLTTEPDHTTENNLLSLPECPSSYPTVS